MVKVTEEPDLRSQAGRLRYARMKKFSSMRGAANAFGWNENTYKSHELGIRRDGSLTEDDGRRYARAFGISFAWLMTGRGDPNAADAPPLTRSVPIIESVAAGRLTDPRTQLAGEYQTIEISGLPPGDYFATKVDGTSMNRISPPGSLILVNRAEREPIPGRRYIFARRGETTYKRFEREPLRLEPETTDPESNPTIFPKSEEDWDIIGRVRVTLLQDL